ncbi:DNA double-strand break repair nuclease NurA [Candidatus Pyrohabitans sp.]
MLELTYETFARKRRELKDRLEVLLRSEELQQYRELWHEHDAEPVFCTAAGVDGSSNCIRYKSLLLYAVNAVAVSYDGSMREQGCADVDFLIPYKYPSERVDLYRSTMELKVALSAADDVELLLLDGSLHSALTAPKQWWRFMEEDKVEEVMSYLPVLEENRGMELLAKRLGSRLDAEQVMLLEYLEYLVAIQKLIERGVHSLVAVAKTSTDSSFNRGIPDMAVLEEITSGPGYSIPRDRMIKMHYPIYDDFFRSLVFTRFYARLERGKDMLMIELPREVGDEEIRKLLSRLRHLSVEGYPYLLKRAHRRVVISNREIERIATSLGIGEKTGREVLAW